MTAAEPIWVKAEVVIAIHAAQLLEHGGADGIRDRNALDSALASPEHLFHYGDSPDLAMLAARYAYSIVGNHPFVDGSKRTGALVCITFLGINGIDLDVPEGELSAMLIALAEGGIDAGDLADWIRGSL